MLGLARSVRSSSVTRHTQRRRRITLLSLSALAFVACTSSDEGGADGGESIASTQGSAATTTAPPASTAPDPFVGLPAPPEATERKVPKITTVAAAGAQTIHATTSADWTLVAFDTAWVSGLGGGMGRFDVATGRKLAPVKIPQGPCAAADAGSGAVWTITCDDHGVARIDSDGRKVDWLPLPEIQPNEGESTIGVGEGSVWAIADGPSSDVCGACVLVKIHPQRLEVVDRFDIPPNATAVRAGLGGVWIVYQSEGAVLHVDPKTGEIVTAIAVGAGPLFFDVGEGGVWVMNQLDGSVSHVDPATDTVKETIAVDGGRIIGGDLTVGDGSVWVRGSWELVAQIDPRSDRVVTRYGKPAGSGSASAGNGMLWVSAHDEASVYRIPT